ncbi:MAG: DUF2867 domain-containing protein [Cypionkella sp.]|uniref:DUF2867 domain-containing protein n=1 Tax=Cypionkella sp. TaxID=2811411 RepID=UPI002ABB129C|nr:DUF2867 domain-containing protein [Cypionkella sp.]MDZ4310963.1 DUF2867 domain-containing protein [Cypionkella sp.]
MQLPNHAQLIAPRAELAYLDSQSVELPAPITALQAWRLVMAKPLPGLGLAFKLRDAISARFGVARIGGFSGAVVEAPQVGDHLDFFLIEHIDDQTLSLTARDRHLDVMTCITVEGARLAITASVVTHNWFGRLYMLPVAPAHRLIVWAMLRRLRRG